MASSSEGTQKNLSQERPEAATRTPIVSIVWFLFAGMAPAALYVSAVMMMAALEGQSFEGVLCFDPDRTPSAGFLRVAGSLFAVVASVGFLFAAPGILGTIALRRWPTRRDTAHIWSLAVNTATLVLIYGLLRMTGGVNRISLTVGWAAWTFLLAAFACRSGSSPSTFARWIRSHRPPVVMGILFVLVSMGVFFPEQFLQCFNEDGTETYELARSLRSSALPTWEIETGKIEPEVHYGPVVVNPSLINSYWTSALQVLLGEGELTTRLPYWVWWLGIFFLCCRLIGLNRSEPVGWLDTALLGLLVLLISVLFTFYVGYNPYMADLANPGVTNALFTLCFLAMLECLFHRDRSGFAAAVLMGSLVFYSGVVMLGLILAAAWFWQPMPRWEVWRWGRLSAGLLCLIGAGYLLYGAATGVLDLWIEALDVEYVYEYFAPVPRWQSAPLFLGYFVLGSGGAAAWGVVRAFRQGPWQRTAATATCGYLAVVLMSGIKNLHYLGPLLSVPLMLLLGSLPAGRWKPRVLVGGSFLVCLALSWPAQRSTFVLNRQFGEQTTFATDSYPEAIQWARLRYGLQIRDKLSWECDQHSWVAYSVLDRQTMAPRPLLVTTVPPPSTEYQLVAIGVPESRPANPGAEGTAPLVHLYTRDSGLPKWMASQQPLRPLDRYPLIFRPLADGPFSPHNNRLNDFRRFGQDGPPSLRQN